MEEDRLLAIHRLALETRRTAYQWAWRLAHAEEQAVKQHAAYVEQITADPDYNKKNYAKDREKAVIRAREYRLAHPAKMKAYWRERKTGCTQEQYDAFFEKQQGKCAVCGQEGAGRFCGSGKAQDFCVDHNHETGVIRGLLCGHCNCGLGHLRDDPTLLRKAADYLDQYK